MPYVRKNPKAKKTYRGKKKGTRRNYRRALVPYNPQYGVGGVIPPSRVVSFCYTDSYLVSSSTPTIPGAHRFALNSIFDPDSTGIGHQPLGHDEMAQLYRKYKVLGTKITARFMWDTSAGQAHRVGIYFDDDTSLPTSQFQISEKNHNRDSKILLPNNQSMQTIVAKWSGKKWFKDNWVTDGTSGIFGANPVNPGYAFAWVNPMDGAGSFAQVRLEVTIEYITKCYDPKDLPVS